MPQRTKIVATLGPASDDLYILERMLQAGMDVARLNFSHGNYKHFEQIIENLKKASEKTGYNVAIMQDLQGPKIRTGILEDFPVKKGQKITLTALKPKKQEIPLQYKALPKEVTKGDLILIDDGLIELKVLGTTKDKIHAKTLNQGIIKSNKGINVPTGAIRAKAITKKDFRDLKFGLKMGVDYVALSFVSCAKDIANLRKHLQGQKIIAKIERKEAIENLEEIIQEADGIMVARGDLGLEIPAEQVPIYQKEMIHLSNEHAKPVIVATHVLQSMISKPRPTRAEISDAANAIFDRADAFMLSNETAVGKYPLRAVQTLASVARATEKELKLHPNLLPELSEPNKLSITDATALNAINLAKNIKANRIVIITESGYTARQISKYRPFTRLLTVVGSKRVKRELAMVWGLNKILVSGDVAKDGSDLEKSVVKLLRQEKLVKKDMKIVIIAAGKKRKVMSTVKV